MFLVKKRIEKKMNRINKLRMAGRIDKKTANEQILQFAQTVVKKLSQ